jgi:selenide,water dikinase
MESPAPIATDIIPPGAGHAQVEVLRRSAMWRRPGIRLAAASREPESLCAGTLPSLLRGTCDSGAADSGAARTDRGTDA